MSTISAKDKAKIHFKEWGAGRPVVFSHGWPLSADAWDDQMIFLASHGFRAIAHDRRGHGRSEQTSNGNDLDTYADDLAALLVPERVLLVARTLRFPATDVAEWDVPAELSGVAPVRHAAEEQVREWDLGVDPLTVELIVSELVTNAVRHGAPPVVLRLLRGESTLTLEVRDGAATAPHLRHAKAGDEGGRGLHICSTLADA